MQVRDLIDMLKKEDPEKQVKFSSDREFITSDFILRLLERISRPA
jgi:hypothetical protein